jgi:hypothetical protein
MESDTAVRKHRDFRRIMLCHKTPPWASGQRGTPRRVALSRSRIIFEIFGMVDTGYITSYYRGMTAPSPPSPFPLIELAPNIALPAPDDFYPPLNQSEAAFLALYNLALLRYHKWKIAARLPLKNNSYVDIILDRERGFDEWVEHVRIHNLPSSP